MQSTNLILSLVNSRYILTTPNGRITFKNADFAVYKLYFEAGDLSDEGRMDSNTFFTFLTRARLEPDKLEQITSIIAPKAFCRDLCLELWLVACKLISLAQISEKVDLNNLIDKSDGLPMAIFTWDSKELIQKRNFANYSSVNDLRIDIRNWKILGDGLKRHVLYRISYNTDLATFSKKEHETFRRFRDFRFLSDLLEKNYPGYILPYLANHPWLVVLDDSVAEQRARLLCLYLSSLARHPRLKYSFEVQVKLDTL